MKEYILSDRCAPLLFNVIICPDLLPLLDRFFFLNSIYVKLLPSFKFISHPITFLRMDSSFKSRSGTSYLLINNSLLNYSLILISKVKRNSNPVQLSKSQLVMFLRCLIQSMSLSVINSATASMCSIAHTQN